MVNQIIARTNNSYEQSFCFNVLDCECRSIQSSYRKAFLSFPFRVLAGNILGEVSRFFHAKLSNNYKAIWQIAS